jgi:hypothetical protein
LSSFAAESTAFHHTTERRHLEALAAAAEAEEAEEEATLSFRSAQ